jgi:hypothetical protein
LHGCVSTKVGVRTCPTAQACRLTRPRSACLRPPSARARACSRSRLLALAPALAPPPPSPSPRCSQPDEKEKDLISFLEACQLGDLNSSDPENPTVLKFLEGGINVRIECDKGEMPLHKLARVQLTDRNQVPRRARARAS